MKIKQWKKILTALSKQAMEEENLAKHTAIESHIDGLDDYDFRDSDDAELKDLINVLLDDMGEAMEFESKEK